MPLPLGLVIPIFVVFTHSYILQVTKVETQYITPSVASMTRLDVNYVGGKRFFFMMLVALPALFARLLWFLPMVMEVVQVRVAPSSYLTSP